MRRLAYMVAGVAMLAGPAIADDRGVPPVNCDTPSARLSPNELERCRRDFREAEEFVRSLGLYDNRQNTRGVTVIRGNRVSDH